ncbi:GNAT family N-acetyltransferase [Acetobacteraceae bacterium]|nr:GNAT family N-acetyltransferase [Acetobacteraceae bacterium]
MKIPSQDESFLLRKREITLVYAALMAEMDKECFASDLCWSEDLFVSALETGAWGELLIIEDTPVGFQLCRSLLGETEILTLGILPKFQGKKLGRQLISSVFEGAKKRQAEEIFLEVEEGNLPARALYVGAGFKVIGMRRNYYGKERHALVMRCNLKEGATSTF